MLFAARSRHRCGRPDADGRGPQAHRDGRQGRDEPLPLHASQGHAVVRGAPRDEPGAPGRRLHPERPAREGAGLAVLHAAGAGGTSAGHGGEPVHGAVSCRAARHGPTQQPPAEAHGERRHRPGRELAPLAPFGRRRQRRPREGAGRSATRQPEHCRLLGLLRGAGALPGDQAVPGGGAVEAAFG
eukprot:scaffold286_cov247-Pinguiococcus_pyrenoidosus.AAC.21